MNSNLSSYLALISILIFLIYFHQKTNIKNYLLFVLYCLPIMALLATKVSLGGFRVFDVITIYCLIFNWKIFTSSIIQKKLNILIVITLIAVIFLGSISSESPSSSLLSAVQILPIFIYAQFLVIVCSNDILFYLKIINAIKFSVRISLFFILIQYIYGLEFSFYSNLNQNTFDSINNSIRYPGFFHDTQASGQFLAMGSFLFLYDSKNGKRTTKLFSLIYFLCCIIGIILSGSRSALSGFFVGFLVLILFGKGEFRKYTLIFSILCAIFYAIFVPSFSVMKRVENIDEDYKFRQLVWSEALKISFSNPYLGIGIGNFQRHTSRHNQDLYLEIEGEIVYFDQPESGYLKILSEIGFIGLSFFLYLVLSPLLTFSISYMEGEYLQKALLLLSSITSWLLAFNSVYSLFDSRIAILFVTTLILLSIHPKKYINFNYERIV